MNNIGVVKSARNLNPMYQAAKVGETVHFYCTTNRIVRWEFKDGILGPNVETGKFPHTEDYWLRITNVRISNAGIYLCHTEKNLIVSVMEGILEVSSKKLCFEY